MSGPIIIPGRTPAVLEAAARARFMHATERIDWSQVRHGRPPCFYLVGDHFCMKPAEWLLHGTTPGCNHPFIPLTTLLAAIALPDGGQ